MLAFLTLALLAVSAFGQEADFIESQIIGGSNAYQGQHPYQASLQSGYFHYCGGSLISATHVITAAHCVNSRFSTTVVLGEHNLRMTSGNEQRITSYDIKYHEGFRGSAPFPNDIALLRLSRPATLNNYVKAIKLPTSSNQNFDGRSCTISGWGTVDSGASPSILQTVSVNPLTNSACAGVWGSRYILDTNICVGNGLKGACNGDSGGPLACDGVLAGATSWGIRGCKTPGYPSVYTRVSKFLGWIRSNM